MATVRLSKQFTLQAADFLRGALLAVGTAVLTVVQQSIEGGVLKFNWGLIATTAISAFIAYLLKNGLFEPPKTIVTADSNQKAVNATETVKDALK